MKRLLLISLMSLALHYMAAADREVLIPVYLTDDQRELLPEKTDFEKIPQVVFKGLPEGTLSAQLERQLTALADSDVDHSVYSLMLQPSGTDTLITVIGQDVLALSPEQRKSFKGDLCIGRAHFIILENERNKGIFKALFRKSGGNVRLEHVFEFVPETITFNPSSFRAIWSGSSLSVTEYVIGGNNLLSQTHKDNEQ